jgi:hypothetical protein
MFGLLIMGPVTQFSNIPSYLYSIRHWKFAETSRNCPVTLRGTVHRRLNSRKSRSEIRLCRWYQEHSNQFHRRQSTSVRENGK